MAPAPDGGHASAALPALQGAAAVPGGWPAKPPAGQPPPRVSRQGAVVPFTPIVGPDAWVASEYRDSTKHIYTFTAGDIAELEQAVAAAQATGKAIKDVTKADFPLPTLGPKLGALLDQVTRGRGFQLLRGLPVQRWSRAQSVLAYWGCGLHWGKAVSNNAKGHLVGHIKDIGLDPANPNTRLFATTAAQPFHNDSADVVALLCLRNACEGGLSSWASSVSVYNAVLQARPDLAAVLAGPWHFDRKGEVPPGKPGFFEIPVLNFHQGYLSVNYSENYFQLAQRHAEVPRLTPAQREAMALFSSLAASDELCLDAMLQPGDVQLLSNHVCLHARTAFTDFQDVDEKRHMLRLWLAPPGDRPLPEAYRELLGGSLAPGERGGIVVAGTQLQVTLEAE